MAYTKFPPIPCPKCGCFLTEDDIMMPIEDDEIECPECGIVMKVTVNYEYEVEEWDGEDDD